MDTLRIDEEDASKLDIVYSIIHACALDLMEKGKDHWINYYDSPDKLRAKFEHGKVFILYFEGTAIGTVSLSDKPPEYYIENTDGQDGKSINYVEAFEEPNSSKAVYRSALAILPEYQNQKFGKRLIEMTEEYCREQNIEYIRFDTRNDYLLDFYNRIGYKVVGQMPDGDVTYYLVEKNLSES